MIKIDARPAPELAAQGGRLWQFLNVLQPVVINFGLLDVLVGVTIGHTPAIIMRPTRSSGKEIAAHG